MLLQQWCKFKDNYKHIFRAKTLRNLFLRKALGTPPGLIVIFYLMQCHSFLSVQIFWGPLFITFFTSPVCMANVTLAVECLNS